MAECISRNVPSQQHHGKIKKTNFLKKNEKVSIQKHFLLPQTRYEKLPKLSHGRLCLRTSPKTSNHLLGPKPFPLDRLLAIFYSVVDSRVAPTASIFSQVGLALLT